MKTQSVTQLQRKSLGFAAVALAVCGLAACSNSPPTPPDAATAAASGAGSGEATAGDPAKDKNFRDSAVANGIITARKACDLLTQADSEAAVGQPLPKQKENLTLGMCQYNTDDFSAGASITVGSWESIKNAATGGAHQPQAISGVGDEALALSSNGSNLYVRKGDEGFLVEAYGPKMNGLPDKGLAKEQELALKILGKF